MFWTKLKSKEYNELYEMVEKLRIKVDMQILEIQTYKQKLKGKKVPIEEEVKEEKKEDILLSPLGESLYR